MKEKETTANDKKIQECIDSYQRLNNEYTLSYNCIDRRKKNKSYKLTLVNKTTNIKVDGVVNDEQIQQFEIYGIDCISSLIREMQMEIKSKNMI